MKYLLCLLTFLMISCESKSQESKVDLSKANISYQEIDKETGWKRVLLIQPNKWGFIDDKGEIKIPFVYDFINPFENGIAYSKMGIMNSLSILKMRSSSKVITTRWIFSQTD